MRKNQNWTLQPDGTMQLLIDEVVPDMFDPLTTQFLSEVLDGVNVSATTLTAIITTYPVVTPHSASDVDVLTSYRIQRLLASGADDRYERINKTVKQLLLLGFSHEVRLRVLEGKATTAADRTAADAIATSFISFATPFRTIRQEGEDYKTLMGW